MRAWHFSRSWESLVKRPATFPLRSWCLDIFCLPPGDSEVINQVDRLSSSDTKIAPGSLRTMVRSSEQSSFDDILASSGWCRATTLGAARDLTHGIFNQERHLYTRDNFKLTRAAALTEWRGVGVA